MNHIATRPGGRWRTPLAGLAATMLAVGGAVTTTVPAQAEPLTETFSSPDGVQWEVPADVHQIDVEVVGAGAGIGRTGSSTVEGRGGVGARITGSIDVTPGETYTFFGATMGSAPPLGNNLPVGGNAGRGFRDGGSGSHKGGSGGASAGGGGGGASAIEGPEGPVLVAGGGGGGGGWGDLAGQSGGDGGSAGHPVGDSLLNGGGGSWIGGGAGGTGDSVDGGEGTTGNDAQGSSAGGGGGGGGYLRGGSGGNGATTAGGGGGGGGAGGSYVAPGLNVEVVPDEPAEGADARRAGFVTITYEATPPAPTETALAAPATAVYGQVLTIEATVTPEVPHETPRSSAVADAVVGEVELSRDGTVLGSAELIDGVATFTVTANAVGEAVYVAEYGGSEEFEPSTSEPVTVATVPADTTTILSVDSEELMFGERTGITVQVEAEEPGAGTVTGGVVELFRDGTLVATMVPIEGVAMFSVSSEAVGEAVYVAEFGSNVSFNPSMSDPATVTTVPADTTTTLSVDLDELVVGEAMELTAQVAPVEPGAGVVTGEIEVQVEGEAAQTVELDAGVATLTVDATAAGEGRVSATYLGSTDFNASSADEVIFQVSPVQSTLELDVVESSLVVGETASVQATVGTDGNGVAPSDGTVQFSVDGEPWGEAVEVVGEEASIQITGLEVGEYTIEAEYSGNAAQTRIGAVSAPVTLEVAAAQSDLELVVAPGSTTAFGQPVELEAILTLQELASTEIVGDVEFFAGEDSLGIVTLHPEAPGVLLTDALEENQIGVAALTVADLPVGDHELRAVYSGAEAIEEAESEIVVHEIEPGTAEVSLTTSPEPSDEGDEVTITATVDPGEDSVPQPTGSVQFAIDGTDWDVPVELTGNLATLTVSTLPVGISVIEAHYSGDEGYEAATSSVDHTVAEHSDGDGGSGDAGNGDGGSGDAGNGDGGSGDASSGTLPETGLASSVRILLFAAVVLVIAGAAVYGGLSKASMTSRHSG